MKNIPDKVYVQLPSNKWMGRTWDETPIKEGDNPNWKNATNIEYTRTDAFIEKACNAYCKVCKMPNCRSKECKMIKDFKKYMEGE